MVETMRVSSWTVEKVMVLSEKVEPIRVDETVIMGTLIELPDSVE